MFSKIVPSREQWKLIQELMHNQQYDTAITLLTQLLEISPWSIEYREERSNCYIKEGDILSAISDLRGVNRLSQDSTHGYVFLMFL